MSDEYIARQNEVYYLHPIDLTEELFLTVHPSKGCTKTPEQQAEILAFILNIRRKTHEKDLCR